MEKDTRPLEKAKEDSVMSSTSEIYSPVKSHGSIMESQTYGCKI